jgi:hypothetical protein
LLVQRHAVCAVLGVAPSVLENDVPAGSRTAQLALSRLVVPPLQLVVLPHAELFAFVPDVT